MILYRLRISSEESGHYIGWHGSKRQAEGVLRFIRERDGDDVYDSDITRFKIATDKAGLLHFLNHHTPDQDNG